MLKNLKLSFTFILSIGLLLGLNACSKPISDKKAQKLILGTWKYEDLAEITFEAGNKASVKLTSSGLSSLTEALKKSPTGLLQSFAGSSGNGSSFTSQDQVKQAIEKLNLNKSLDASYTITKNKLTITGKQKRQGLFEKLQGLELFQNVTELFPEEGKLIELSIQKLTKKELMVTSGSGNKYSLKK